MPFEITWYEKGRIVNARALGNLDLDEIADANRRISEQVNQGKPPVHLFIDATAVGKVPTNLNQLKKGMEILNNPNLGWAILIGANPIAHFLATVISQVMKLNFTIVATTDDAVAFLARQDSTLASLKDN
jgi:hypothetical protein